MADLVILKFDNTYGAQQALAAVRALQELRKAWVDDVAVLEKHKSGRVSIHSPHGSVSGGALFGGLIGMLLFWWFPPGWFLAGWLGGMGIGAATGEAMKRSGIDQGLVEEIRSELTEGTSALAMIGVKGDVDEMAKAFEPYNPVKVIRHELPDETVANLKDAYGSEDTPES